MKVGDVVQVRERSRNMALVLEALQLAERDTPDYIEVDPKAMAAKYHAHAGAGRSALSGEDGAEPGGRVLRLVRSGNFRARSGAGPDGQAVRVVTCVHAHKALQASHLPHPGLRPTLPMKRREAATVRPR